MIHICAMLNGIHTQAGEAEHTIVEILAHWQRRPGVTVEILTNESGYAAFSSAYPRLVFAAPSETFSASIARLRQMLWAMRAPAPGRIDLVVAASPYFHDVLPALWLKVARRAQRMAIHVPAGAKARWLPAAADFFWASDEQIAQALAARGVEHTKIEHAYGEYQAVEPEAVFGAPEHFDAIAVGPRSLRESTDLLLKAWRIVRNRFLRAHLVLSGNDEPRFNTRARIEDLELTGSVSILDGMNDGQLAHLLRRARMLVIPKRDEEDERMVLAALASGVPCVTFDVPAFRYAFPYGRLIAQDSTPEALAAKIVELLEKESVAQALIEDVATHARLRSWGNISDILWSHAFRR